MKETLSPSPENKKARILEILDTVRQQETGEAKVDRVANRHDRENFGYSFSKYLLKAIAGHSGLSYGLRTDSEQLGRIKSSEIKYDENKIDKALVEFLEKEFTQELVLDLGAGFEGDGYAIADAMHAGGYVGDELNFAATLQKACEQMRGNTPFSIVSEDMGRFLNEFRKFELKPKVVMFSGIDNISYKGSEPFPAVLKSIADTMAEEGLLIQGGNFGYMEEDYGKPLDDLFEEVKGDWQYARSKFYRKRK